MVDPTLAVRVLGPVELLDADGRPIGLGPRQRRLLAALVANDGRGVAADALMDLLWPGELGRRSALHAQVSRLRKASSAAGGLVEVHSGGDGYRIAIDPSRLDAARFEALLRRAASSNDPAAVVGTLRSALALWRGPAFGTDGDRPGVIPDATRLDELRASAREDLGAALVDAGAFGDAVAELDAFVSEHPLRERALAQLIRALYLGGRQTEALARYEQHRHRLAEELGIEPSPELQRLELEVLRHDVTQDGRRPSPGPPTLEALPIRFVTRSDGHRVACTTVGAGPDVVVLPAWVTSLEVISAGRDPRSTLFEHLARRCRLTLYDRAGTGLSPGPVDDVSLDAAVDELLEVLRATGPATLLALSQSGPVAVSAAAQRPDLVRALALVGTYASASLAFPNERTNRAAVELFQASPTLGARLFAGLYRPDASEHATDHLSRVLLDSAPTEITARYLEAVYDQEVGRLLPELAQPAIVVHYTADEVVPFRGGQQLASDIEHATFVPLDGNYHLPDVSDVDRIVDGIVDLAEGTRPG